MNKLVALIVTPLALYVLAALFLPPVAWRGAELLITAGTVYAAARFTLYITDSR